MQHCRNCQLVSRVSADCFEVSVHPASLESQTCGLGIDIFKAKEAFRVELCKWGESEKSGCLLILRSKMILRRNEDVNNIEY